MKQHTIGIQVKTMSQCVGISLENQFKISVEYNSTQKSNVNPQIDISVCSFTDNKPDESSKQISVIKITPKEYQTAELIQLIFKHLRIWATQKSGIEFNSAFYSVPESFTDSQKQMVLEAGIMANLDMKSIDEHIASALTFSSLRIVQPEETILIFDLSEGGLQVVLMITVQGQFEVKFRLIDNNSVPKNINKLELNNLWEEYGQNNVQSVLDDQNQVNNVALVAAYPNVRMMHLTQLFFEFFERRNIQVSVNINPEWGVAYGAALMAQQKSLLNIDDFMTIDAKFDTQIAEAEIINYYKQENKLQIDDICILLFDYIKRRCKFSKLINLLSIQVDEQGQHIRCHLTKSALFNLLMKNSDTYLRTLLLMACSKFMPVPLISYDWDDQKLLIWKELFYIFEKRKAILNFKLSKNKMQGPRGCTTLANQLFNRDFEQHTNMLTNQGSIDIQFDYNFACPLYVPVADAHGYLDSVTLRKVYNLFDIFIIHIVNREEDKIQLDEEIQQILMINRGSLIIVLEHDQDFQGEQYQIQKVKEKQYIIKSKHHEELLPQVQFNLREEIIKIVFQEINVNDNYLADVKSRISSLGQFKELLQNFDINSNYVQDAITVIEDFINLIRRNSDNLHSKEFLPLNYAFARRCQIYNSLLQNAEMDAIQRENLEKDLIKEDQDLKNCSEAPILKIFEKIIKQKNFVGMSSIIAKLLKGYLEGLFQPLLDRRQQVSNQLKIKGKQEVEIQNLKIQMQLATQQIENKWFSNEHVIRELYLLGKNQKYLDEKYYNMYTDLAWLQIQQGQPFEVIDGNNLQFISGIYDEMYQNIDDSVLVVSVIGPQSSGKSLLLNFLFGTQFQSSAGRCTKGVYGTIIELKTSEQQTYKKILLLDTEGIQAAEGRDVKFDKRIVFFIFCVSHVVLICNKGEMNNQMSEVIKLAADAMSSLKESRVRGTNVYIVMNMLAEINKTALQACITALSDAIIMNNDNINISDDNVFMLPFAFDCHGNDKMKVNQPSENFSEQLEPLRQKILDKTFNTDPSQSSIYTMKEWFKYANGFWTFTLSFNGVFDYENLEQKREDVQLLEKINTLMEENFSSKQQDYKIQINQIIENVMRPYQGLVEANNFTISSAIQEQFLQLFQQITSKIQADLLKYCGEQNISFSLRDKKQNFLLRRMNQHLAEWKNIANIQLAQFSQKKAKTIGDQRLQKYITQFMAQQETYTDEYAAQKFEEAWYMVEPSIVNMLKTRQQVTDEIFQLIRGYYENEIKIKENGYIIYNIQERQQLQKYQTNGTKSLIQFFIGKSDQFFFFNGHQIKPNPTKIIALQERENKFLLKLTQKFFVKSTQYIYFDIENLIRIRFNINQFLEDIYSKLIKSTWSLITRTDQVVIDQINLNKIIALLQQESQNFDLGVKVEFQTKMKNFKATLLKYQYGQQTYEIHDVPLLNQLFNRFRDDLAKVSQIFEFQNKNQLGSQKTQNSSFKYFQNNTKILPQDYHIKSAHYKENSIQLSVNDIIHFDESILRDDQLVQRYFKYLKNPSEIPVNQNSRESEKAKVYFFNLLNHNHIVRQIEIIVLQQYKRDGKFENETVEDWLKSIKTDKTQKMRKEFCKIDRKIVQAIIMNIRELISQIDDELEPFCLKTMEVGIHAIHLIAQTFINALAEEIEYNAEQTPFFIWEDSLQFEKNIFIAKLTSNDIATDFAIAEKIGLNIFNMIVLKANEFTIDRFKKQILLIKKDFAKNQVIQRLEDFAMKAASVCCEDKGIQYLRPHELAELENEFGFTFDEVVSFYVDPREFLKKKFLLEWDGQTHIEVANSKKNNIQEIRENLSTVINFFQSLQEQLKKKDSNLTSLQLFVNQKYKQDQQFQPGPEQMQIEDNLNNKNDQNRSAAKYLIMMLTGVWEEHSVIDLSDDLIYIPFPNRVLPLPQEVEVINPSKNWIIDEIISHLQGEKISKLDNYIQGLVQYLQEQKINELQDVEIIGNHFQDFKNNFVGCNEYCPQCRRECDIVHDEAVQFNDRIHQCEGGHQLQCFGGIMYYGSNEAVTISCNHIKDNEVIIDEDKQMQWSEFKKTKKSWIFDVPQARLLISDQKNTTIWNSLGPQICEYYNKGGKKIKFVPTSHVHVPAKVYGDGKTHYILLLDRSGSMSGQRWRDLMIAVTNFMKILEGSQALKHNCRVSIIGHDTNSQEICYNQVPSIELVKLVKFTSGGNDFFQPLRMALKFMEKSFDDFDKFVVCFMSDGGCALPTAAINEINSSRVKDKLDFRGIGYGEDAEIMTVMQPMTLELNGTMVIEVNAEALSQAFEAIIINTY